MSDEAIRRKLQEMCAAGNLPTLNEAIQAVGGGDRGRLSRLLREVCEGRAELERDYKHAVAAGEGESAGDAEAHSRRMLKIARHEYTQEVNTLRRQLEATLATVADLEGIVSDLETRVDEGADAAAEWRERANGLADAMEHLRDEHGAERKSLERQIEVARASESEAIRVREEAVAGAHAAEATARALKDAIEQERQAWNAAERIATETRSILARVEAERDRARDDANAACEAADRAATAADRSVRALSAERERILALEAQVAAEREAGVRLAGVGEQLQLLVERLPTEMLSSKSRKKPSRTPK